MYLVHRHAYTLPHPTHMLTFECITEGCVNDEQKDAAADGAKRWRLLLNPILDKIANNLHHVHENLEWLHLQ